MRPPFPSGTSLHIIVGTIFAKCISKNKNNIYQKADFFMTFKTSIQDNYVSPKINPSLFSNEDTPSEWPYDLETTIKLLMTSQSKLDMAELRLDEQVQEIQKLEQQTITDSLTGLLNRRGFEQAFDRECDRTNRFLSKGGVFILIDLDNFKVINDMHGHNCGDACLKLAGMAIQNSVRPMDTAARLGGDEFVIILPDSEQQDIARRAQKLIKDLNKLSLMWEGKEIKIRASAGLKSYGINDTPKTIFAGADKKLYRNKCVRKG